MGHVRAGAERDKLQRVRVNVQETISHLGNIVYDVSDWYRGEISGDLGCERAAEVCFGRER